jgi:hypothetical protein
MSQQEYITALHDLIDGGVDTFNSSIPDIQNQIAMKISLLIKDLDIDNQGNIVNNIKNVKLMGKIKSEVTAIVLNKSMESNVNSFIAKFNDVANLQNQYFKSINKSFKADEILNEIRKQSITSTVESLSEAGLNTNVIQPIVDMLQQNITTGGSWKDLNKMLQDSIVSNDKGLGTLERYTTTLTTDSLNQFSAQYTHTIASSLNYKWFKYTGSLIRTSREFCDALKHKQWVHISELPQIVLGNFTEFDKEGNMNQKTGLPKGMVDGTNATNFFVYRGGYNCRHQLIPTDEVNIPQNLREQFKFK